MSDANEIKLFPHILEAVLALEKCCDKKSNDGAVSMSSFPIARSEVYNETWLLRLVLALLHDYEGVFQICDEVKKDILNHIRKTVARRWISEGGLHPAFGDEGPTWTDAIIGDVGIDTKSSRGVVVAKSEQYAEYAGIIIVEAKIGSDLASGITNSPDYNQAARNVACLAKLVMGKNELQGKCSFVVLGPRDETKHWKGADKYQQQIDPECILRVIEEQEKNNRPDSRHPGKQISGRAKKWDNDEMFRSAVKEIRSVVISWEELFDSMACEEANRIRKFYDEVLDVNRRNRE